jgi:hypothetical protein
MIQSGNISRRRFLSGVGHLSLVGFLQLAWPFRYTGEARSLAKKLANFHVDKGSAKIVGLAYLRSVPSEAKVDILIDLISSLDVAQRAELAHADEDELKEILLRHQRQDFEHERVVNIRGWILSETECRLCALAALV